MFSKLLGEELETCIKTPSSSQKTGKTLRVLQNRKDTERPAIPPVPPAPTNTHVAQVGKLRSRSGAGLAKVT